MAGLIGKLLSEFASSTTSKMDVPTQAQQGVFYIRPSPKDSSVLLVHASGESISTEPSYFIRTSKKHIEYHRVEVDGNSSQIGEATVHQWSSSSADVALNGRPVKMAISSNSGHTKFEMPLLGEMKWKEDHNTGSGLILCDDTGRKIAKYGSAGHFPGTGCKKLELLISVDMATVEEIVFAAVLAKAVNKAANEAISKVLKPFIG
jgi:hypothetical protein